jgi:hypothetical protein
MASSRIVNALHNIDLDIDEDFELPIFEKKAKVQRETESHSTKISRHKQTFKRYLLENENGR